MGLIGTIDVLSSALYHERAPTHTRIRPIASFLFCSIIFYSLFVETWESETKAYLRARTGDRGTIAASERKKKKRVV